MHILSIGKIWEHDGLHIDYIEVSQLPREKNIENYDYIIINGGDGSIRRVLKQIHTLDKIPKIILNPTGSFNVIAKIHQVPKVEKVLHSLANGETLQTQSQKIYAINKEVFLFSAGNMGDLQHIFLSETLRFGILEKGIAKYLLSAFFLFPVHLIMTPFMLLSKRRFFIFTPFSFIKKFGTFYGKVEEMSIDLKNEHNFIELDGDVVNIESSILTITTLNHIQIVTTINT